MTQTIALNEQISQLETEIDELQKSHQLLSLNLPSGVKVECGGDFYELLRVKLANEDSRAEAERVLIESKSELKTKQTQLQRLQTQEKKEASRLALAPKLEALHKEVEIADAIAAQLNQACEKLAQMDAAILREFAGMNTPGWSGLTRSTPISQYKQKMIRITHSGGGAVIKARY